MATQRVLLGLNHVLQEQADHGAEEHEAHAAGDAAAADSGNTLALRCAAIAVIFAGALLLGLPTLVVRHFQSQDAPFPRLLRAFAGGTIVALALVHIIPEAIEELDSLVAFPIGGVTVLGGILLLVMVDSALAAFLAPEAYKQRIRAAAADAAAAAAKASRSGNSGGGSACGGGSHHHHHDDDSKAKQAAAAAAHSDSKGLDVEIGGSSSGGHDTHHQHSHRRAASAPAPAPQPHGHQCMRSLNATGWVAASRDAADDAAAPLRKVRSYVTAYTMELGCIFHSIIIGVGLGVLTDKRLIVTLMIAVAVHQGLEALALGSVLALTSFRLAKKIMMLLLYSITAPAGIAIGIAVSATYDPESATSRAVQGTLNGVSGGMLLYIAMYQLIAEEFSREDLLVRRGLRLGMYCALLLGAALMCVLAVWS